MPTTDALRSLDSLFLHELRELYSAERQLTGALEKMTKAASHDDLKEAFREHLEETRDHAERLRQIFSSMGKRPEGAHCDAMEGLIQEGKKIIDQEGENTVKDAALIAVAQRVEHYEIASYGTVVTYADELGLDDVEDQLEKTLSEEKAADKKLNKIATGGWLFSGINREAELHS